MVTFTFLGLFELVSIYLVLYFLMLFFKSLHPFLNKIIFCPVCGAFFGGLLIGFIRGYDPLILSLLTGVSAVGSAYYIETHKKKSFPFDFFLLALLFTTLGFLIIWGAFA